MKVSIGRAINLLQTGLSVITIGNSKRPNFAWKQAQTVPWSLEVLTKNGNYKGGLFKKNGDEIEATQGYGILTGYNGLECIDVDLKVFQALKDQTDFWNEFIKMLKDHIDDFDRKFVIYKTVNSGYHIIYRCEEPKGNRKIATLKGNNSAIIETRGKGGYIFIYDNKISNLGYEEIQLISNDDRAILFGLCKYFDYVADIDNNVPKEQSEGLTPWDDYNKRTKVTDLIEDEFDVVRSLSDRYALRKKASKDPLHGYIYKDTGLCYLFTTATIYPHEKPLSPFSIYAYKFHNGNFSDAASELYKKGFGERKRKKIEFEKPHIDKEKLEFPIDVYPESIQHYILENAQKISLSIDYMGCSMLWLISLCVGNSCRINIENKHIAISVVWIGLLGDAGVGKTPSVNAILRPLKNKNAFEVKQYNDELQKYEKYISLSDEEKKNVEKIKKPKKKQFIVGDATLEALTDLHEENPNSVGVFKDELAGWVKDMNKYRAGSDKEFWLSCWSGEQSISSRRTAKSVFIDKPSIPVLGGIQPTIFAQIATEENKENGFLDRMLVSYPDIKVEYYNRNYIDPELIEWYDGYISGFYENIRKYIIQYDDTGEIKPWICEFTKDALNEYIRIHTKITDMQNSDHENEYVKSMLAKQKIYIPRFALLLNCLESYDLPDNKRPINFITKHAVLGAEKLSDYFISMAKKVKITSLETRELKDYVASMKGMSIEEKLKEVCQTMPDFNKKELASLLNISRGTIYNYLKKLGK